MKQAERKKNLFIIFGASRGLGMALAEIIKKSSANELLIINRRAIRPQSKKVKELAIDLSTPLTSQQLSIIFRTIAPDKYRCVFIVNNASVVEPIKPLGKCDPKKIVQACNINFINYAIIIDKFIKYNAGRTTRKKILNITSGTATSPHFGLSMYCSTKAALEMLTKCIFMEQQKLRHVKVLAIRPGIMDTRMQQFMRASRQSDFAQVNVYKTLYKKKMLLPPRHVAQKIYRILNNDNYWRKAVRDVREMK